MPLPPPAAAAACRKRLSRADGYIGSTRNVGLVDLNGFARFRHVNYISIVSLYCNVLWDCRVLIGLQCVNLIQIPILYNAYI